MDEGRSVGQHGQCGALGPGKVVGAAAVVPPGCRLEPHDVAAERGVAGVQGEDFIFAAIGVQPQSQNHFDQFFGNGARLVAAAQADDLHRERAGAATYFAAQDVEADGPENGQRIDARMIPEPLVFKGDDGPGEFFGNRIGSGEAPLAVRSDPGAHQLSVAALQDGTDRIVEQLSRLECQNEANQACEQGKKQQKSLPILQTISYICII